MAEKILDLDPFITAAEKKQDIPPGLLKQIIDEVGTGIPPKARASILEKFGLDAKLSNANAVEAAGILLSDALANNKGDAALALAEYRSGKDRAEWGTDTAKFVRRVRSGRGMSMEQAGSPVRGRSRDPLPMEMGFPEVTGSGVDVAKLQQSTGAQQGFDPAMEMVMGDPTVTNEPAPQPMVAAAAPSAGRVPESMAPPIPSAAGEPEGPVQMGPKSLAAYTDGTMPAEKRAKVRALVKSGALLVPEGFSLEEPGMMTRAGAAVGQAVDAVGEMVTGDKQKTATTEAASDITMSPEWMELQASGLAGPMRGAGVKDTALRVADIATGGLAGGIAQMGRMAASPAEQFQIILANNPNLKPETDEKGNRFFKSANGQIYSEQPGLRLTDVPRIAANVGAFLPAGAASGVGRAILANAGTQLGLEAGQAAVGGEVNPGEVLLAGAGGAVVPALGKAKEGLKAALNAAPVTEVAPSVANALDDRAMGVLLKQASKGDVKARETLAAMTDVNAADLAAFRELGIEPAADIVSDNPQMRALAGLTRSKVGSEAESKFQVAVQDTLAKADDVMASFDAQMIEGAPAPGLSSSRVLDSLKATQTALESQEKELHGIVNKVVPKTTGVQLNGTRSLLRDIRKEVGDSRLTAAERSLMDLADDPNATYGALMRVKGEIGEALKSRESPFAGVDKGALKRMYGALAQDQVDNVERLGGEELRKVLRQANVITGTQKRLEERMIAAFGKDLEGSIGPLMTRAIKEAGAGAGGSASFKKLMAVVPPELKREVLGTALAANFRKSVGGGGSVFDLAGFASKYEALRANPEVYSEIVKQLGPSSDKTLRALYTVSKRLTEARGLKLATGKANQMLEGFDAPSNLVETILSSAVGRGAVVGAVAAKTGGIGGGMASMMVDAFNSSGSRAMDAAADLMTSPEFRDLAIASAGGIAPAPSAIRKVAASQRWRDFAKAANLPRDPAAGEQFLSAALQAARQTRGEQ